MALCRTSTLASIALVAVSPLASPTAIAQTTARTCHLRNPILAVAPEVYVPGLGHLYIGEAERRRGTVLLGATLAGAALIVFPAASNRPGATVDNLVDIGADVMIASWLFSMSDIVPALVRERRRCERGDERSRLTVRPTVETRRVAGDSRLAAGLSVAIGFR